MTEVPAIDLSIEIGGLALQNPVGTASGTYGKGLEFQPFYEVARLGFVGVKTITTEPREGNPPPRLCEIPGGLMNSIGLPNPGVDAYIETVLPKLRTLGAPVVIMSSSSITFAPLASTPVRSIDQSPLPPISNVTANA